MFVIGVPMHPEHHELLVRDVTRVRVRHGRRSGTGASTATSPRSRPRRATSTTTTGSRGCAPRAAAFDPATQIAANHPIDREMAEL